MMWRRMGRQIGVFVKTYYKPFLFLLALNLIALVTILRDHYTFTDDLYRAIYGDAWIFDFNRYASSILSYILHQSFKLFDISPIPQIVAMMFMAATSMMLVKLFVGDPKSVKKSFWPLLMASFVTLSPFMINAWMYEFDAPCMAMAIFVSVLPYVLFWDKLHWSDLTKGSFKDILKFVLKLLVILVCVLAMWMSFQAAGGVFLAIGLALLVKDRLDKKKHNYFQTILFIFSYLAVSALVYFLVKDGKFYRNISTFAISDMFSGIMSNLALILKCTIDSLRAWWAILLAIIGLVMIVLVGKQRKSWHAGAMLFMFLPIVAVVGIGPYIALIDFPVNGRSMMGFCLALSLFMLICWSVISKKKMKFKWLIYAPVVLLLYSFMTFSWSFGNALASQYEHDTIRVTMISKDLAEIYTTSAAYGEHSFRITGSGGFSAVMTEHFRIFPAAKYVFFIAQEGVNSDALGHYRLFDYSDINTSWVHDWFDADYDCSKGEYEVLRDNYYYTIRESKEKIKERNLVCIDMKEQARPAYYGTIHPIFTPILNK